MTPDSLAYDEHGLVPAVIQEAETGEVLMVAWMDREAVAATLRTGLTHFWSRSRQTRWRKGETSGHSQHVQGVYADCDADTLLVQVHQDGVACHTGNRTCFFTGLQGPGTAANMLDRIEQIVAARKAVPSAGSYVAGLLARGEPAICRKIGEEAVEVVTAALGGEGDRRVVEEVADLWFHTLVLLGERSIPLRDVLEELARRHAAGRAPSGRGGSARTDQPASGG
jgi:phosphoribosyl-AMP cyclohydrolase / phosphoribosyl-ATP pyrophosphohydrolase